MSTPVRHSSRDAVRHGGNPIDLPGGNLDLAGPGASSFLITNTTTKLRGNISKSQTVEVAGPLTFGQATASSSFTNYGRFIAHYADLNLPSGDTFTNAGTVGMRPGTSLFVNGNLTNAASGLVFDSGNDTYGGGTGLTMATGRTFDNRQAPWTCSTPAAWTSATAR